MVHTKIVDLYGPEGDFESTLYENSYRNNTLTNAECERLAEKLVRKEAFEWVRENAIRRVLVEHLWWDNNRTVVSESEISF